METVLQLPDVTKSYAPITIKQRFTVKAFKPSKAATEMAVLVDSRPFDHGIVLQRLLRRLKLNRYRIASGAVSVVWMFAALAALASGLTAEPFFALFFSTFGLYLVFVMKCREL